MQGRSGFRVHQSDVGRIRELAYLEVGHDDEDARINGLAKVIIEAKLTSVLDHERPLLSEPGSSAKRSVRLPTPAKLLHGRRRSSSLICRRLRPKKSLRLHRITDFRRPCAE
jgi:hypothetical protein